MSETVEGSAVNSNLQELEQLLETLGNTTSLVDRHLVIAHVVEQAYLHRREDPRMAELCIRVGRQHIEEFDRVRDALEAECCGALPPVRTFDYVADALEEAGLVGEALVICVQALAYGLESSQAGGFRGRIIKLGSALNRGRTAGRPEDGARRSSSDIATAPPPCPGRAPSTV